MRESSGKAILCALLCPKLSSARVLEQHFLAHLCLASQALTAGGTSMVAGVMNPLLPLPCLPIMSARAQQGRGQGPFKRTQSEKEDPSAIILGLGKIKIVCIPSPEENKNI